MMTPARRSDEGVTVDWHWVATTFLTVLILLVGNWARELGATQQGQDVAIVALRLTDERREEQFKNIVGALDRIEKVNTSVLARIDSIRVGSIPCGGKK